MIVILVTIVILLGAFFVATLYYPTNKRARRIARSRAILEAQVESSAPAGVRAWTEGDFVDVVGMDINFFKNRKLSPMRGIPDLLEQINRMGNQMNIRFVAVKPLEDEDDPAYRKYPFLIETRAAYPELVNFVHRIENGLGLSLNDLRIESDQKDPSMHRLQFTLNTFELKDELPGGEGLLGKRAGVSPEEISPVSVHRDPFGAKKATTVSPLPEKPKPTQVVVRPKRRRPKLVLMGILDIAGNRIAIINNKVMRPGETIGRRRIEQIEDDHVILVSGEERFPLYLKNTPPPKRREVKQ